MFIFLIIDEEKNIIAAIYEKQYKRMLYIASQILGKTRGEEAVHDVFVNLIEKNENNISELCNKPAWFYVIVVRNHSINLLSKERIDYVPLDEEIAFDYDLEERVVADDSKEKLARIIRSLNPTMREALEYRYIFEYSNEEIAEILGITQNAVAVRINRAKKALKEKLEEREGTKAYD